MTSMGQCLKDRILKKAIKIVKDKDRIPILKSLGIKIKDNMLEIKVCADGKLSKSPIGRFKEKYLFKNIDKNKAKINENNK